MTAALLPAIVGGVGLAVDFVAVSRHTLRLHQISSNNARRLLGTIYLSKSIFLVDSDAPVASESAYTAIVAGRIWLQKGPVLTLNANYQDTNVPVPPGLLSDTIRLVK